MIKKKYDILLPLTTLGDYLYRWGFTPQKPVRKAYKQNSKKVQQWLEKEYPVIAANAKKEGAVIYWVDESDRIASVLERIDPIGRSESLCDCRQSVGSSRQAG